MKFRNLTKDNIKYNIKKGKEYIWKTARPGEIVYLPLLVGESVGLTKIEEVIEKVEIEQEKHDVGVPPEPEVSIEVQKEELPDYRKFLRDINGVGPKSTADIMEKYPTIIDLKEAVARDEEIHNHDGVDRLVKAKVLEEL